MYKITSMHKYTTIRIVCIQLVLSTQQLLSLQPANAPFKPQCDSVRKYCPSCFYLKCSYGDGFQSFSGALSNINITSEQC